MEKIGLKIKKSKTKIMRIGKELRTKPITVGKHELEEWEKFRCLGIVSTSNADITAKVKENIIPRY